MKFKPLDELRLADLSDEDLIKHLVKARDTGDHDQFKLAINILATRRWDHVLAKVVAKVVAKVGPADAEDVAMDAMTSAIGAFDFKGSSMGEFVSGLNTIVKYRIADYHAKKKRAENDESIDGGEDEDFYRPEPGEDDGEIVGLGTELLIDDVLERQSDVHRRVVELRIEGYSAKETAARVNGEAASGNGSSGSRSGMTPSNVDQIHSRFKKELKTAIEESGGF